MATGPKPLKLNPGPASLPVQTRRGRAASISWPAHWAGNPRDGSRARASRGEPGAVFPQCPDPTCGHRAPLLLPSKGTAPKGVPCHWYLGSNVLLNPISFLFYWSSHSKCCPKNIAGERVRAKSGPKTRALGYSTSRLYHIIPAQGSARSPTGFGSDFRPQTSTRLVGKWLQGGEKLVVSGWWRLKSASPTWDGSGGCGCHRSLPGGEGSERLPCLLTGMHEDA